jgi:hypothetical protein
MRCPVCKADNAPSGEARACLAGRACRRCKADLGLLFALEDERSALLAEARRLLDGGAWSAAADAAARADGLRRDDDSRRLLTAALLLGRDFDGAWRTFRGGGEPGA